jgi:hypothetical protein
MLCPSCQFENMPGSGHCARCGALLALATAVIDVHPPRARRLSRRMPRLWGRFWTLRQSWANFRAAAFQPLDRILSGFEKADFTAEVLFRTIVPGWAQRYRGRSERGRVFFVGYLALLLPGIIFLGTHLGSMLLGLAFAWHVTSTADALVGRCATIGDRLTLVFACTIGLTLVLYLPVGWVVSRIGVPVQLNQDVQPFSAGDVLWCHPTTNVAPGDFVVYEVPEATISRSHARYIFRNSWINRVCAVGGQTIHLKDGQLLVDGHRGLWQSQTIIPANVEAEFKVPDGQVLIPPNSLVPNGAPLTRDEWMRLGLVPRSSIDGRIFFRSQPLWRISAINGSE